MGISLSSKIYQDSEGLITHYCPGCKKHHTVNLKNRDTNQKGWTWNNDPEYPTLTPSVQFTSSTPAKLLGNEKPHDTSLCHYFLSNGLIIYLHDCVHELALHTVVLPNHRLINN